MTGRDNGESGGEGGATPQRTLADLSKRLGTLEHSLTVVATEIGVSGFPTFKHIDPREVYDEALRLARGQLSTLETQIAATASDLNRKIDQKSEHHEQDLKAQATKLTELERRLHILAGNLSDLAEKNLRREQAVSADRVDTIEKTLEAIDLRIDTLWDAIETAAKAEAGRASTAKPATPSTDRRDIEAVLDRNRALEMRLAAQESALTEMRDQMAGIAAYLQRAANNQPPPAAGSDIETLRDEIAIQLRSWLAQRQAPDNSGPIVGSGDSGALIMSAAERAIVRLTHRIERLEEWRDTVFTDNDRPPRSRSGLRRLLEG